MTIDEYAEGLAERVVSMFGAAEAPGVLLQAMMLAHLRHHSLNALVLCLERTVADLRQRLISQIVITGTVQ